MWRKKPLCCTDRLMLAVLGGLADVERDLIRTRTAEARSRAKAQGKAMGRPPFLDTGTAERRYQTARRGRDVEGIGGQLRPQHRHHAPRYQRRMSGAAAVHRPSQEVGGIACAAS
jgi:hypothetical protein